MASFGKVLDLLDERYLNLQDVSGNVEPLPSLVPYEDYVESILVYRMDANHEILLGLLHEFTANMSQQLSQELWTWFVQWDVDTDRAPAPSPKKIRLDHAEPHKRTDEDPKQRRDPIIDIFERCVIDSKLFEQEEMLRILIDIVQVESSVVPNYIEFLYRWIDFHEGDGKALKAALKWEIPSLWDFEYHPLLLPEDLKKTNERHRLMEAEERKLMLAGAGQGGHIGKAAMSNSTEQLAEALPTNKMREKPDLAAIERQTEASERLQYREVKYGIQPPKVDTPLPPLINIPRNPLKRLKYYAACYRSRQRALVILMEAGLSMKQIGAYQRLQDESVQDTPTHGVPEESRKMPGLRHYHKDSDAAQLFFKEKEKLRSQREKQAEIALSERLMSEAQVAAQRSASDGSSGVPLIPATPSYSRRPDMAADMLARIRAARGKGEERINFVPSPMVGLMNARLFEDARDRQLMSGPNRPGQSQTHQSQIIPGRGDEELESSSDEDMASESDEEMEAPGDQETNSASDEEGGGDIDDSSDSKDGATPGALPASTNSAQSQACGRSIGVDASSAPGLPHGAIGLAGTAARPLLHLSPEVLAEYMQSMSREQAHRLVPLPNQDTGYTMTDRLASQIASNTASSQATLATGAIIHGFTPSPVSTSNLVEHARSSSSMVSSEFSRPSAPNLQPQNAFQPTLPALDRPPTALGVPEANRPTLPFLPPPVRPPNLSTPSVPQAIGQTPSHPHGNSQMQNGSFANSQLHSAPQVTPSSGQGNQRMAQGMGMFSGPPQITRTTQVIQSTAPTPRLPSLPQLPARANEQDQLLPGSVRRNLSTLQSVHTPTLPMPMPSNSSSPVSPSQRGPSISIEHILAMRRQRAALAQGQAVLSPTLSIMQNPVTHHNFRAPILQPQMTGEQTQEGLVTHSSTLLLLSRPPPPSITVTAPPPRPGPLPTPTLSRPGALPRPTLGVSGPTLQRTSATNPLSLAPPPPSPLTSLAPSFLCTTPFRSTHTNRIPILIYFPRILVPGLPHPFPLGDNHSNTTDAFMLGYTDDELSDSSTIDLSKALFLPTGCWTNVIGKVQRGKWKVLETYQSPAPPPIHPKLVKPLGKPSLPVKNPLLKTPHHAAYTKLSTAFNMMQTPSPRHREASMTKRWRATPGPMSLRDRGAVWEGWGAVVDKGINMSAKEREGALAIGRRSKEEERIERELEELMEWEEENGVEWD